MEGSSEARRRFLPSKYGLVAQLCDIDGCVPLSSSFTATIRVPPTKNPQICCFIWFRMPGSRVGFRRFSESGHSAESEKKMLGLALSLRRATERSRILFFVLVFQTCRNCSWTFRCKRNFSGKRPGAQEKRTHVLVQFFLFVEIVEIVRFELSALTCFPWCQRSARFCAVLQQSTGQYLHCAWSCCCGQWFLHNLLSAGLCTSARCACVSIF